MATGFKYPTRKEFLAKVKQRIKNPLYITAIELAQQMAKYGHRGQTRDNGERYYNHVIAGAWSVLTELKINEEKELTILIITILLHDLLEDTFLAKARHLHFMFDQIDPEITFIIWDVTKPKTAKTPEEKWRRLIKSKRRRTKIIKAVDRLHNQRTLKYCSKIEKIYKKNKETDEIIIPWLKEAEDDKNIRYLIAAIQDATQENKRFLRKQTKTK